MHFHPSTPCKIPSSSGRLWQAPDQQTPGICRKEERARKNWHRARIAVTKKITTDTLGAKRKWVLQP